MAQKGKVTFPKKTVTEIFDCNEHEICGLDPEQKKDRLTFTFWRNPSKFDIQSLLQLLYATPEELREMSEPEQQELLDDFYKALSSVVVDTNIDGLDFSTPESAKIAYEDSPELPMGFVYTVVISWLTSLVRENLDLKKVSRLLSAPRNSGKTKKNVEENQLQNPQNNA